MARASQAEFLERSGELFCDKTILSYRTKDRHWFAAISDIRLIAEYTTSDGPFIDDYFLAFLSNPEDGGHVASFYAKGRDEVLAILEEVLSAKLKLGLTNSTDFRSRIIWPLSLTGEEFLVTVPHKTAVGRFWQKHFGAPIDVVLTDAAKSAFK